jgi:hypothetical protein
VKLNLVYSISLDFIPMPSVQSLYPFLLFDIKWKKIKIKKKKERKGKICITKSANLCKVHNAYA